MNKRNLATLIRKRPNLAGVLVLNREFKKISQVLGEGTSAKLLEALKVVLKEARNIKKGDKGDRGERGERGPQGPKPVAGVDYTLPKDGKPGERGRSPSEEYLLRLIYRLLPKTKDGESPTDKKLVELIKPLLPQETKILNDLLAKIREQITIADIKNLSAELTVIKKNIGTLKQKKEKGGGGGGMGNPQHEVKNVNSSTTSVSLTYKVAANGRAIWAYYQGQNLVYGTHYTISGKTMPLLFTPQDSTFIDITYIRGS